MATFTITLGPHSFSKTISAPHIARFLAAYRVLYGQIASGPADPVTGIVPMRDRTDAEVAGAIADGLFNGMKANVKNQEASVAAKTASDAITDVTLT